MTLHHLFRRFGVIANYLNAPFGNQQPTYDALGDYLRGGYCRMGYWGFRAFDGDSAEEFALNNPLYSRSTSDVAASGCNRAGTCILDLRRIPGKIGNHE